MKKLKLLMVPMILGLVLVGCSNEKSKEESKGASEKDVATVEIKEASYVKIGKASKNQTIELDVKVKNNSDSEFVIMEDSFYLVEKDDDEKISAKNLLGVDFGSVGLYDIAINGQLAPDKSLSGKVFFDVDKDKEYTLNFVSNGYDEETGKSLKEIEMPLNLKDMADSEKKIEEPLQAFQAYVDVIFLNKENENYDKLVVNDKASEKDKLKKEFSKRMKSGLFSGNTSDEQMAKAFEQYATEQVTKFEAKSTLEQRISDKAQISVSVSGMNSDALFDSILKAHTEYYEKSGDFDAEKENNYVLSNFDKILKPIATNHVSDVKVVLIKEGDKWNFEWDSDKYYENKELLSAYFGSRY